MTLQVSFALHGKLIFCFYYSPCYLLSIKVFVHKGVLLKNIAITLCLVMSLSILSGCSSTPSAKYDLAAHDENIPVNNALFSETDIQLDAQKDLFSLTLTQQNEILSAVSMKQQQGLKLHQALYEVLKHKLTNFTYYGETYNAETAMRLNKGNCMSLAVLTTAYAKLLGVDFSYREVSTLPIFEKQNNLILSSSHVQTILYDSDYKNKTSKLYLRRPSLIIDYFPDKNNRAGKYFDEAAFISMYYKNLAGDALIENDLDKAFMLANEAYQYNNNNIEAINSLAIIHRRAGDEITAEIIYQAGLKIEQSNLRLLSNYIMLLKTQQRFEEAEIYQAKLNRLDDPNPFHWLEEAYTAEKSNNLNKAKNYYLKALNQAPYLNQAYMGLYHIYLSKGQLSKAKHMLNKALEWTYEIEQRKLYKHKLYSLAKR